MTLTEYTAWRRMEDARIRAEMREKVRAVFRGRGVAEDSPACKAALEEAERQLAEQIAMQEAQLACVKAALAG